jgi:hypothetical protein
MKNNISPQYLSDLVPDTLNSIHSHNTINYSIIPPIRTRTSLCTNYFSPATIRSWNLLPEHIKSNTSVNSFKSNLKFNHPHKSPYYFIGKRLGQILLTPRFVNVVLLKQQNIICYTALSTTYTDSFLLSPFLTILWFHMIIIFLDRPS